MNERWCEFGPLRVGYDASVLEPRQWTVVQSVGAAWLLDALPDGPVLELHCGVGHIGQAVAVWSGRSLVQVDDSPAACAWAHRNAVANNVCAEVRCGSIEELRDELGTFALVLADPPYVPSREASGYPEDPQHAIDGGPDGLDGFRTCIPVAVRATKPGGAFVLQVRGVTQADAVRDVVQEAGLSLDDIGAVPVAPDRAVVMFTRR